MIACVVPVHDEELHLQACLDALTRAGADPELLGESVVVVVVLDACSDRSKDIALQARANVLETRCRNVGVARNAGADLAIRLGARWLAFTDADSQVAPDWLARQLETQKEVVCGTVEVTDWLDHPPLVQAAYLQAYEQHDGHRHVHGANLGISAETYIAVGGFPRLPCHEDVGLVAAAQAMGVEVAWSARPRVVTSARRTARVTGGFATFLARLELSTLVPVPPTPSQRPPAAT